MAESPVPLLRAHARFAPWNARGLAAHAAALSLWYDCGHVTAITPEQAVDNDLAEAGDLEK